MKKVIRYLRTTKHLKFTIKKEKPPVITTYCDLNWARDRDDRKSTTENVFKLGNNFFSLLSRKQNCVALSTAEAE